MALAQEETKPPILHILVVGFHHKLGCQVGGNFSYISLLLLCFFANAVYVLCVGGIFIPPSGGWFVG